MARNRGLEALVFVVGAASLGTEIAAARLLAPYFGASMFVWANTIAVVLVALSTGYAIGGRLADRTPHTRGLARLVVAASVALAAVPFVARPFLELAVNALDSVSAGAFFGSLLAVLVLVAGPVVLLGMVAPYAIRLSLASVEHSGRVSGRLYAISTAGSLAGTFLAALLLVPFAGTHRTFIAFALVLAAAGAIGAGGRRYALAPAAMVVLLVLPPPAIKPTSPAGRVVYETETPYQYARVIQSPDGTRRLELNEGHAVHSVYRPWSYLTNDYWDDFLVDPAAVLGHPPRSVAILGDAAGTTARAYGHYFPQTSIDAVEIDSALTDIGRRWFGLAGGARLHLHSADARPFLRASGKRYDAIFLDAYRQPYIPFYLTTEEFFALCRAHLSPGGVVVINVGHPAGTTKLEKVLAATLRAVFPHVERDPAMPTNTLLVASVRRSGAMPPLPPDLRPLAGSVSARMQPALAGGEVYTDDRAPVEWLIDRSIVSYAAR